MSTRRPGTGRSNLIDETPSDVARAIAASHKPVTFQTNDDYGKVQFVPPEKVQFGLPEEVQIVPPVPNAEDDPPLNQWRRFRLEPDDRGPLEFVGKLVATGRVVRQRETVATWLGLYETRAGKGILEMFKYDGSRSGSHWDSPTSDESHTVRVFDNVDAALSTVKSASLRHLLLADLGRESVEFIE